MSSRRAGRSGALSGAGSGCTDEGLVVDGDGRGTIGEHLRVPRKSKELMVRRPWRGARGCRRTGAPGPGGSPCCDGLAAVAVREGDRRHGDAQRARPVCSLERSTASAGRVRPGRVFGGRSGSSDAPGRARRMTPLSCSCSGRQLCRQQIYHSYTSPGRVLRSVARWHLGPPVRKEVGWVCRVALIATLTHVSDAFRIRRIAAIPDFAPSS